MQLRNLQIPAGAVFAPMAGLTDAACRHLMADHGAAWTVSEMASAKALNFNDQKSFALLKDAHPHGLYAIQLFGCEPEALEKAILLVREKGIRFDILDINMGCPAPKIVSGGAGSKLMLDPDRCGRIVEEVVKNTSRPVTVKMRKGWDKAHPNVVELAQIAEQNGAAAVAVHGRTREEMYSGHADWDCIRRVKAAVHIPVIGNGDVTDVQSAALLLEQTGCDAIMIGRGAMGNPWLFRQINAYLTDTRVLPEPGIHERMAVMLRHIDRTIQYKGERTAMMEARHHAAYYTKGLRGGAGFRRRICQMSHFEELAKLAAEIAKENAE